MSTRAVVTIRDERDTFHIYTHFDGYPEYQVKRINDALVFAWKLPRFEAMDFAAAFVRGAKECGGNIYFTKGPENHSDLEYKYIVTAREDKLLVAIFNVDGDKAEPLWSGTLGQMRSKYGKQQAA